MTELLDMKRVRVYLGGPNGSLAETTTRAEREAAAHRILRYRTLVWDYALQTATTVIPPAASVGWEAPLRMVSWLEKDRLTPEDLPGARRASAVELGTVQDLPLVELWRRTALAALVGRERELPLIADKINIEQAKVVLRDVADLVRGLVILDTRYSAIPGWQRLGGRKSNSPSIDPRRRVLVNTTISAAQLCSQWAGNPTPDDVASTDRLGHLERAPLLPTPYPFGVDGAIAALHNTYVRLGLEFPRADVATAIVRTQRQMSALALQLAESSGEDEQVKVFTRRAERCARVLGLLAKDVGGNIGSGNAALGDAEAGLSALAEAVQVGDSASAEKLESISRLFTMVDRRIATRIRQGIHDRYYLVCHEYGLSSEWIRGVRRPVRKFEPITKLSHPDLIDAANRLDRGAPDRIVSAEPLRARSEFTALLESPMGLGRDGRMREGDGARDVHAPNGPRRQAPVGTVEGPGL
ncbi:hypothetical protein [Georgenia yuyongxinii]|uniref:Uncharacterized protein n=1 Tax=Georgenia yuyongxinii TaxID=2589797 RepID=A0A552WX84_9MICO|nr:hypothetical protein [Georgenia yuyongxinii]TRW47451.1 hypothetical protein FJ693_01230 [Georgenia yuyongxinii]